MKFTKKFRAAVLGAAVALMLSVSAVISYAYDGNTDPLISLSYLQLFKSTEVDPQIASLNAKISDLELRIAALQSTLGQAAAPGADYGYEVIEVKKGTRVLAAAACDIMLRSGSAVAVSSFATQGLSDYTAGAEVMNNENVAINHMLLIPRADGRGILITSETAFIMIRGEYKLES